MAGKPLALTPQVHCSALDCHETGLRVTHSSGRPTPPPSWYEVVIGRTVLFACSKRCAQKVKAGLMGTARPTSDVPIDPV